MEKNNISGFNQDSIDFLSNDLFLLWKINPTHKLDEYWDNFIANNPQLKTHFQEALKEFEEIRLNKRKLSSDRLLVWERIERSISSRKNRKKRRLYYSSAAAVALLLIISTFYFQIIKTDSAVHEDKVFVLGSTISDNEIQFFSGGEVINLSNNSSLNLSGTEISVVIQDSLTQREIKLQEETTNKLIIPYGKRSSLILADGSKVWLNSGTEMEFPSIFSNDSREIKVTGEIYIEVAKRNSAFIVHTPNSVIRVLGTSFNVSAYADDQKESVVLVEGSLQIKSNSETRMLSPHELAEIENGKIMSKAVEVNDYISWKHGYMQLNKVPIYEVLRKVGRYYNVEFRYNESSYINTKTCSGKLVLFDDIDDVLEAFSDMTLLNYEKTDNKTIFIKKITNAWQ